MQMHRMTDPDAAENTEFESFYVCDDCSGGAVMLDIEIDSNEATGVRFTAELLETKGRVQAYDETCILCDYSPADDDEDEDDEHDEPEDIAGRDPRFSAIDAA